MNSSVENLNDFKQMQLEDGRIVKPIGMELKQICVFKYKQFQSSEEEGYVFDLSGSLTTLVGPNSSGKTTLLEIVRIFCTAVKHGSKCYSLEEIESRFGIKEDLWFQHGFNVRLQGTFNVHYGNQNEVIKSLTLYVSLKKMIDPDANISYDSSDDIRNIDDDAIKLPRIHVHVTRQPEDKYTHKDEEENSDTDEDEEKNSDTHKDEDEDEDSDQSKASVDQCPAVKEHGFLNQCNQRDYEIFEDLFPQIISFNSKTVTNDVLESLYKQYPNINEHEKELSKEIKLIFPFIQLNRCFEHQVSEEFDTERPCKLSVDTYCHSLEKYEDKPLKDLISLPDVRSAGEGVLQCLYIIITVCCAKTNSIILIDEPDAHVFALAQKLLIHFFYRKLEAFRRLNSFCQMVITTHSPEIMQAVKLKDIRQIHIDSKQRRIIGIKSLECNGQLLNVMTDIGTAIFTHSELVNLGCHRKLLYLENHDDYNFLRGIIHRFKPDLLDLPFTRMAKGGRTTTYQIRELISQLRQLVPKENMIHIFVLVDPDLRCESVLQQEKEYYDGLEKAILKNDEKLNVKIYYHYWAVREWENWLLSNENLLYEMLCDDEVYHKDEAIKKLRDQIQQHQPAESIFRTSDSVQHDQPMTTITSTQSSSGQSPKNKQLFDEWFNKELNRHFQVLLTKLTATNMQGIETISAMKDKETQREMAYEFLNTQKINDDIMNKFGFLREPIIRFIGYQLHHGSKEYKQQEEESKKQRKNAAIKKNEEEKEQQGANASKTDEETKTHKKTNASKIDQEKELRSKWLTDRKLPENIETLDETVKKEVTKWIDAKLFFSQLTNGQDNEKEVYLDSYWKQAFAMGESEADLYKRYFNSFHSEYAPEWPEDFNILLEKFKNFVIAP